MAAPLKNTRARRQPLTRFAGVAGSGNGIGARTGPERGGTRDTPHTRALHRVERAAGRAILVRRVPLARSRAPLVPRRVRLARVLAAVLARVVVAVRLALVRVVRVLRRVALVVLARVVARVPLVVLARVVLLLLQALRSLHARSTCGERRND